MKSYLILALIFPVLAFACAAERVSYAKGYTRETAPGQPVAAVYIHIKNKGNDPVTIQSMTSPAAEHVMVHTNQHQDHSIMMVEMDTLVLPAHETVALKPGEGNSHIMLMGLKQPLKAGEKITLHVLYDDGSMSEVTDIPVKPHEK